MLMYLYRAGNFFYRKKLFIIAKIINGLIRVLYRCAIFSESSIGGGTKFSYGGIAVVIHRRTIIGKNCRIGARVTIGGRSGSSDVPVIGDNCYLGTGSVILGPVVLGDNVTVGANAVVLQSFPAGSVVAGVPAKLIRK